MYFTYIIRCKDDSLYTGYTTDIVRRMKEHESGINCKYSRVKGFKRSASYVPPFYKNLIFFIMISYFLETLENKECYNIPYNE